MVRKRADWPTSVLNISARLGPSQSILGSPDALRKGRMASETAAGAVGVFALGQRASAQQEAGNRQRQGGHNSCNERPGNSPPQRFNGGIEPDVPAALLSFQVLRSARMAEALCSARPNRVPGTY